HRARHADARRRPGLPRARDDGRRVPDHRVHLQHRDRRGDRGGRGRHVLLAVVWAGAGAESAPRHLMPPAAILDIDGTLVDTNYQPDLVNAALEKLGMREAVMVGDTPWDIKAAKAADVPTVAVLTGGFGADELEDAGAAVVFESIVELRERIGETPLG